MPFIAMPSCMQQESDKGRLFNPGQAATIFAGENYRPPRNLRPLLVGQQNKTIIAVMERSATS